MALCAGSPRGPRILLQCISLLPFYLTNCLQRLLHYGPGQRSPAPRPAAAPALLSPYLAHPGSWPPQHDHKGSQQTSRCHTRALLDGPPQDSALIFAGHTKSLLIPLFTALYSFCTIKPSAGRGCCGFPRSLWSLALGVAAVGGGPVLSLSQPLRQVSSQPGFLALLPLTPGL